MSIAVKQLTKKIPMLGPIAQSIWCVLRGRRTSQAFPGSATYWDGRYVVGGNSGRGSYGELAEFKARVLNEFVATHGIRTVIEFGCGDGNQLLLAEYPSYLGLDVSSTAISRCRELLAADESERFALVSDYAGEKAELSMSLDVVYHLVEDSVFEKYMSQLFDAAERFVVIYANNRDEPASPAHPHVRHRRFSDWIAQYRADWKQIDYVANPYPYNPEEQTGSFADFYFFSRS